MLGLTMTDIVIMTLGIVSLIIWLMFFIKGMKYNSMFDVLVEKEYPFKEIYGLGYAVLETIKYNYKSKVNEIEEINISGFGICSHAACFRGKYKQSLYVWIWSVI